ncbi:MAG: hypothetical protein ACFFA0_10015 [Promethearchaeota archaeon]
MMSEKLREILKELNRKGKFKVSLLATSAGLVLNNCKKDNIDERVVSTMGTLISDLAFKTIEELDLSDVLSMKIWFKKDYIHMRNIILPNYKSQIIFAILTKLPKNDEEEAYIEQLLDWAINIFEGFL